MDPATGKWEPRQVLTGVINPSFLALSPGGRNLYCVHGGNDQARVSAFATDASSGALNFINSQPSGGRNPVHLSIHPKGKFLVVANYTGCTVAVLPIEADGRLAPPSEVVPLTGNPKYAGALCTLRGHAGQITKYCADSGRDDHGRPP